MRILGIETSCDETAVSVIEVLGKKINVLANVVSSQVKLHAKYGGVVPTLASREHVKNIGHVFDAALKEAGINNFRKEIDLIAVTRGPGLAPALLIGLTFARTLAWLSGKPVIGVNHLDGHVHSNWLPPTAKSAKSPAQNLKPTFPALNLIVSGGHTELVRMQSHTKYKIVGETLDDAVGEAFDKVARILKLGYPGGPVISKLADNGNSDAHLLPSPMLKSRDYNFSYSGLKTAVLYLLRNMKIKKLSPQLKADIAASFQKAAITVLVQKTIRAAKELEIRTVLLSGGVSANQLLRWELEKAATEAGIPFFCPAMQYTGDNAAMIAAAGYFQWRSKPKNKYDWRKLDMDANLNLS